MNVLVGRNVDVIEPFPAKALAQAVGWMHAYKTLVFGDKYPQTDEEIGQFLAYMLSQPNVRSWAVIDKDNLTGAKSPAPLVGSVIFEAIGENNGYFHVASSRKVWGDKLAQPGMMEQAADLVIPALFESTPELYRVSSSIVSNNRAAINFAKRVGFVKDGYFREAIAQAGKPRDVVHFGILRKEYGIREHHQTAVAN